jgi:hypothetical protein
MSWGMTSNGKCLTARITESPRTGKECSLSDILEEHVDQKYFLSEKAVAGILNHKEKNKAKGNGFGATLHQLSEREITKEEEISSSLTTPHTPTTESTTLGG